MNTENPFRRHNKTNLKKISSRALKVIAVIFIILLAGCSSSIPIEQRQIARDKINNSSSELVNELSEKYPTLPDELAESKGYIALSMTNVVAPVVGGGIGTGAIYNPKKGSTTYIDVNRYDLGVGLSAGDYQALVIFNDDSTLNQYNHDFDASLLGAEWHLGQEGSSSKTKLTGDGQDIDVYVLSNSGMGASSTASLITASVNEELTNSTVPAGTIAQKHNRDIPKGAIQKWDRTLPFFAQRVLDKGYSLPLPFGVSVIYADTYQPMQISDLSVGFKGSSKVPIDFVTFDNNSSHVRSPQLKLDAWLFPFMNVFATVGKVSGTADIEFTIDGNGLLNQMGTDCSGFRHTITCRAFQDKGVTVPVTADLSGTNYSIGTVLASGWNSYFVALPISVSYADMSRSHADGYVLNVSPRVGKQFSITGSQSLSVYAGVTYMDSRLVLTGSQPIPGTDQSVDYKVKQENIEKWAGLVGANYNFNQRWSIAMEYGQNGSEKRQFISNLARRF